VREEGFFFQDERFELFFSSLLVWHGRRLKRLGIGPSEMDRVLPPSSIACSGPITSARAPIAGSRIRVDTRKETTT
jgi:hypothetical protein